MNIPSCQADCIERFVVYEAPNPHDARAQTPVKFHLDVLASTKAGVKQNTLAKHKQVTRREFVKLIGEKVLSMTDVV